VTATVFVSATGTEVGKTWVACRLIEALRDQGVRVGARKPVQSCEPDDETTDADLLASSSGESPVEVCPPERTFRAALAPPMAARLLGLALPEVAELAASLAVDPGTEVAVVEGAGGLCSPIAPDSDNRDLVVALGADLVVLVAHAELGTIHQVRSAVESLGCRWGEQRCLERTVVFLNRFSPTEPIHALNAAWLSEEDGFCVATDVASLVDHLRARLII